MYMLDPGLCKPHAPLAAVLLTACALSGAARAADAVQVDWTPNRYRMVCEPPDACQMGERDHRAMERNLELAVSDLKATKFRPSRTWARRVGEGTDQDHIEIYESGGGGVAYVSPTCWESGTVRSVMKVGNGVAYFVENNRDYWVYNSAAHEVFHLVQYEYPFWDPRRGCSSVPGWIMEGTATAYATDAMLKRWPSVDPSDNASEARQIAGMRRYDLPLPVRRSRGGKEMTSGVPDYQLTSSFWQHLADAHYKGDFGFLRRYMEREVQHGDWVGWLDDNIFADLRSHLGIVFAGFLADYSGWGDRGFTGQVYGRKGWLEESFGGCEQVYLDRADAGDSVEVEILPLAGECIEVYVSALGENGLRSGESAAVEVAAQLLGGPDMALWGLHLSLVASTDKERFHCARSVRQGGRKGLGRCVFLPDDGRIRLGGEDVEARVWNVVAQEKDDEPERRQEAADGKGSLVNLYTISYTPLQVSTSDTRDDGRDPVRVRLHFVLDVASQQVADAGVPVPAASRKRTVASLQPAAAADPQTTLPKQDAAGQPAVSFAVPSQLRHSLPPAPGPIPGEYVGKLAMLAVYSQDWDDEPAEVAAPSLILNPLERRGDRYELRPLVVGDTGEFPAGLEGNLDGQALVGVGVGSLRVMEFTDLVFRATYSGTLCRITDLKPKTGCQRPVDMSGDIVKAFAGTRLPGRFMRVADTPGVRLYREAAEAALAGLLVDEPGGAGAAAGGGAPGSGSTSAGGSIGECACTCEERERDLARAAGLKERADAGADVSAAEILGLNRCITPCQREYMLCELAMNEAEEAADPVPAAADTDTCDCSCEGLKRSEALLASLQEEMQKGGAMPLEAMTQIGKCMSVCQAAYMRCGMP